MMPLYLETRQCLLLINKDTSLPKCNYQNPGHFTSIPYDYVTYSPYLFICFLGPDLQQREVPRWEQLQSPANTRAAATQNPKRLPPTPQLTATPDPEPTEQGQGLNPQPHGS